MNGLKPCYLKQVNNKCANIALFIAYAVNN